MYIISIEEGLRMTFQLTKQAENILENILHGVIVTDTRGRILFWNRANQEMFGYTEQEMLNRPINILFEKESKIPFKELLRKCSLSEPVYGRWHGIRKDGSLVWLEVRAKLVNSENSNSDYCVITLGDIDKLKNTENRLNQNRAVFEVILEEISDAIFTADEKGAILTVNSAVSEMFGYEKDELVGRNLKLLMPFPFNESQDNFMKSNLSGGDKKILGEEREIHGLRKDDAVFPIEVVLSEIQWEGDRIFAGVIRDLSARRALERKLIEIGNEERQRIGRNLHDGLGQMLTGIRMLSENLARKLNANALPCADDVQEIAEMIHEADEMVRSIARDMVQVDFEKSGLHVALDNLCKQTTKLTGVNCELMVTETVEIDDHSMALHLYRIIQEAINNAVKHGKADRVVVRLSRNDHHTSITVDDDGVGFCHDSEIGDGVGIQIMKHRAAIMGGLLEIHRIDESVTRIRCIVPNNNESFK
jgi:two-component system sensor kinase FixL